MLLRFWLWLTTIPPAQERTHLEQEQAKLIDFLQTELHAERERYRELVERIAFPPPVQVPFQKIQSVQGAENPARLEARRLSQLSRQRLDAQIEEMERRASSVSQRDEKLSARANRGESVNGEETEARSTSEEASS